MTLTIESASASGILRLVENGDGRQPIVIAHAAPEYSAELFELARLEAKRRGVGWSVVAQPQK